MKNLITLFLLPLLILISTWMCPPVGHTAGKPAIRLAYTGWSSSIASAHVVQAVLQEELGYPVEMMRLEVEDMWQAVAEGRADVMLSAWLPLTHEEYLETYGNQMVDLGANLQGARIGLVVPDVSVGRQTGAFGRRARPYIKAESIADLEAYADQFRHRIIGIDPGAGVMQRTREALRAYDLDSYRLIDGSEVSMTAELSYAIRHQQWIVVTAWTPHWMFARWNLKFLEDPKGVFGGAEAIHTMARPGLQDEMPEVYALLDRFVWTPEESARYMVWNQSDQGLYPYGKALRWLHTHPQRVEAWLQESR